MISVVGYGSLLSEASARETVPDLQNFRLVRVPGYKRIFNKVGIVFISRHGASPDALDIASCSTLSDPSAFIICSQFECSAEAYKALYEREHRFDWIEVETYSLDEQQRSTGLICTTSTDQTYRYKKCLSVEDYQRRVGQFYTGLIWRNDILPFPRYLQFCLSAASAHGEHVLNNFLDQSFLADGKTSLRSYLQSSPELTSFLKKAADYSYR